MSFDKPFTKENLDSYPGILNGDNLADVLKAAKAKKQQWPNGDGVS